MNMDIRTGIVEALNCATDALDNPKIAPALLSGKDIRLEDIKIDSLATLEFIMHLEDSFDIELDEDEIAECATLSSLQSLIEKKIE